MMPASKAQPKIGQYMMLLLGVVFVVLQNLLLLFIFHSCSHPGHLVTAVC